MQLCYLCVCDCACHLGWRVTPGAEAAWGIMTRRVVGTAWQ